MGTAVHPSLFPLLNIDTGREWRRPRNTLESSLSPNPRHVAFAFAFHPSTSYLYVPYVIAFILKTAVNVSGGSSFWGRQGRRAGCWEHTFGERAGEDGS